MTILWKKNFDDFMKKIDDFMKKKILTIFCKIFIFWKNFFSIFFILQRFCNGFEKKIIWCSDRPYAKCESPRARERISKIQIRIKYDKTGKTRYFNRHSSARQRTFAKTRRRRFAYCKSSISVGHFGWVHFMNFRDKVKIIF